MILAEGFQSNPTVALVIIIGSGLVLIPMFIALARDALKRRALRNQPPEDQATRVHAQFDGRDLVDVTLCTTTFTRDQLLWFAQQHGYVYESDYVSRYTPRQMRFSRTVGQDHRTH